MGHGQSEESYGSQVGWDGNGCRWPAWNILLACVAWNLQLELREMQAAGSTNGVTPTRQAHHPGPGPILPGAGPLGLGGGAKGRVGAEVWCVHGWIWFLFVGGCKPNRDHCL